MNSKIKIGDTVSFEDNGEQIIGTIDCANDDSTYVVSVSDCGVFTVLSEYEMTRIEQ